MDRRAFATLALLLPASAGAAGYSWDRDQNLIVVDGVAATPAALHAALPAAALAPVAGKSGTWLLGASILVRNGGTMRLSGRRAGGEVEVLRLRSDNSDAPGGFVSITADFGWIDIRSTRITSWDSAAQGPDRNPDNGRAFIRARSRLRTMNLVPLQSRMDVADSDIGFLGYNAGESYGLTWKVSAPDSVVLDHVGVSGDITGSRIHDNWFGVYSSGLRNGHWLRNQVYGNAQYGLAPHSGTDGLQVEDNDVHDNGNHGITVRRDCARAVIRNNRVHDNRGAGISLHDGAHGALVAGNQVWANADAGILVHASRDNTIRDNTVRDNTLAGIQLAMGAAGNRIEHNTVSGNGTYGVLVGRGRGVPLSGDGQPRGNTIVANAIYDSGTDNVHPEQPGLNRWDDNTFAALTASGATAASTPAEAAPAPAP